MNLEKILSAYEHVKPIIFFVKKGPTCINGLQLASFYEPIALDLKAVPDSLHTEGLVAHYKCHGDQKSSSLKKAYFEQF